MLYVIIFRAKLFIGKRGMKNNIRVERAIMKISQQLLADEIGVSRQIIHAIESGKFIPSTVLSLKISGFFKKSVEEVFQLEEQD